MGMGAGFEATDVIFNSRMLRISGIGTLLRLVQC